MTYAAFLSYDHDDLRVCDNVHRGLEALGRGFFRLRGRRVFRDSANAQASAELKQMLADAIAASDHFILLATPRAAESDWVRFEVERWLAKQGGEARNVLIVVAAGDVRWDSERNDFDWAQTTSIPRVLSGAFTGEPAYCDLRGLRLADQRIGLRNQRFRERIAEVVAPVDGRNKEELVGRYLRVRRQLVMLGSAVLLVLAVLAGGLANQFSESRRQRQILESRQTLAQAAEVFTAPGDPQNWPRALRAALLEASEAVRSLMTLLPALAQADETYIRDILESLPSDPILLPFTDVRGAWVSDDGRRVRLEREDGATIIWDLQSQSIVEEFDPAIVPVTSGDLRTFAWQNAEGQLIVRNPTGDTIRGPRLGAAVSAFSLSPDGRFLVFRSAASALYLQRVEQSSNARMLCGGESEDPVFAPDNRHVAAVCHSTLHVWTTVDGSRKAQFALTPANFTSIAFSENGERVAVATTRGVSLYRLDPPGLMAAHQLITDPDEDDNFIDRIGLDATGGRIGVNYDWEVLECIDALSGAVIWPRFARWEWNAFGSNVPDVTASTISYIDVDDGHGFTMFDACTGARIARVVLDVGGTARSYNPRSRQLALTTDSGRVVLIALRAADLLGEDELDGEVLRVEGARARSLLAVHTAREKRIWDTRTGARLLPVDSGYDDAERVLAQPLALTTPGGEPIDDALLARMGARARPYPRLVPSDDGRFVAIANNLNATPEPVGPDTVEIVDLEAKRVITRFPLATHAAVMRFGPAGHLAIAGNAVATGESGYAVFLLDPLAASPVLGVRTAGRPECLAISDGDVLLAVGQQDNTTAVFNREGNRVLIVPQTGRVVYCDFFDAGTRLSTIGSTTDRTTLRVVPATRAALANRLLQLEPWVR